MTHKRFLPFCGLSFHFLNDSLCSTEDFNFDKIQFLSLFFFCHLCGSKSLKDKLVPRGRGKRITYNLQVLLEIYY